VRFVSFCLCVVVERDRLRERERQARAQMSSQVDEQGTFLFGAPVRVNPSSTDPVTQQIQSKLGDFQRLKPFLDHKDLIGVDGVPPSPGVPNGPSSRHNPFMSNLPSSGGASSRLQPSPEPRNMEFKKPHHHQMHHQHQRGGYVKPADGKPPYEGRGGYPGQPVKHGSGITNHRSNGILPAKGPPQSSPNSSASLLPSNNSSSRIHNSGVRNHPRNTFEQNQGPPPGPRESLPSATPNTDMENIFKEMIDVRTPLTAIAATPRKEPDNKFTFSPKLTESTPAPSAPKKREKVAAPRPST
jgi:hypothetical protein